MKTLLEQLDIAIEKAKLQGASITRVTASPSTIDRIQAELHERGIEQDRSYLQYMGVIFESDRNVDAGWLASDAGGKKVFDTRGSR